MGSRGGLSETRYGAVTYPAANGPSPGLFMVVLYGNTARMKQSARTAGAALLALSLLAGAPPAGLAQTSMTGSQQTALLQSALRHFDGETRMLAGLKNHIPSREVVPVSVAGLSIGTPERRTLTSTRTGTRHAALEDALSKATVADTDRANGQSPDQSSLAEYLQRRGIDPNTVVVVDVDTKTDAQNPHVTVFYRK